MKLQNSLNYRKIFLIPKVLQICVQICFLFGLLCWVTTEDLLALCKHMQVQLREQWDVQQNNKPQEVIIRKGDVQRVRHLYTPYGVVTRVRLRPVKA